jgi:hypothetical protein
MTNIRNAPRHVILTYRPGHLRDGCDQKSPGHYGQHESHHNSGRDHQPEAAGALAGGLLALPLLQAINGDCTGDRVIGRGEPHAVA